jgi:hypothetical protein
MSRRASVLLAAVSIPLLATALASTRWVVLDGYSYGPLLCAYCGDGPCRIELVNDQNMSSWTPMVIAGHLTTTVIIPAILCLIVLSIVRGLRPDGAASESLKGITDRDLARWGTITLSLLALGLGAGLLVPALAPSEGGAIGYAFPVFLLGCASGMGSAGVLRGAAHT